MCKSCSGPTSNNCTSCNSDLILQSINSQQSHCITCEYILGFKTKINYITNTKSCTEICGDGLNMGEHECDDGNDVDGDGCSKECKIEEGFVCRGGNSTNMDSCLDVKSPTLDINPRLSTTNKYSFDFSEPLKILSSEDPKTFLELTITGGYEKYIFDYEVEFGDGKGSLISEKNNNMSRVLEEEQVGDYYTTLIVILMPMSSIMDGDVRIYIYIYIDFTHIFQVEYFFRCR